MKTQSSPFYSLMIDEASDQTLEQYLIVYVAHLSKNGKKNPM